MVARAAALPGRRGHFLGRGQKSMHHPAAAITGITGITGIVILAWRSLGACKMFACVYLVVWVNIAEWLSHQTAGSLATLVVSVGAMLITAWDRIAVARDKMKDQRIRQLADQVDANKHVIANEASIRRTQDEQIRALQEASLRRETELLMVSQEILRDRGILAPAGPPAPPSSPGAAVRSVLFVEDDGLTRSALLRILQRQGFAVETAGTVQEAILAIARRRQAGLPRFDAALVDLMLPGGTGLDVMRRLREAGRTATIVTTGSADQALMDQATRSGAVLIPKPYAIAQLLTALGTDPEAPPSSSGIMPIPTTGDIT